MFVAVVQCRFDGFSVDFFVGAYIHVIGYDTGSVVEFPLTIAVISG